ncbi:MAG: hypothetical protein CUN55_15635 [Phototrophicales bacterium]|nr:MAG: hypothetical protein CUN55_15635 [Phototrophicales bacterium]
MSNEVAYFWLLLTLAFVVSTLGGVMLRRRKRPLVLRTIRGYQILPLLVDEAIESDRQLHVGLGGIELGKATTLVSLAALTLLYEVNRRQAFTSSTPLVTTTDGILLTGAQDMLRRAYATENNLSAYHADTVVWLPTGERSLAYGAAISAINYIDRLSNNIMVGSYGAELALIGDVATRRDAVFVGQSIDLVGQAVAFAHAETPILTEELFVSEAYTRPDDLRSQIQPLMLDVLRWALVIAIILIAIVER